MSKGKKSTSRSGAWILKGMDGGASVGFGEQCRMSLGGKL